MNACENCPYRVCCIFDPEFPCFLDEIDKMILINNMRVTSEDSD